MSCRPSKQERQRLQIDSPTKEQSLLVEQHFKDKGHITLDYLTEIGVKYKFQRQNGFVFIKGTNEKVWLWK